MHDYQREFIEFTLRHGVLRFGEFTLKSGRRSPYFVNTGLFNTGARLAGLGRFYADAIVERRVDFDVLFGPAYKGIPIAAATAVQLALRHDRDVPWVFNRKEAKDHGEGGTTVGAELSGRVLLTDDVITSGAAIREVIPVIKAAGGEPVAVVVAVDRQERGTGELSAIQEVERDFGLTVHPIVTFGDIVEFVRETGQHAEHLAALQNYRAEYGV